MGELRFDGKTVLVTGSGRGLGRAYALLFAQRGANVVVNDPGVSLEGEGADRTPAQDVVREITAAGGQAVANFDSVAREQGAAAMVAQAIDTYGRIDVVVNNAGNFLPKHGFADSSTASFDSLWQVHFMGTVHVVRAAWPHMVAQRGGRIVNTTSHVGYLGAPGRPEYTSVKGAIHGLTRALALEAAAFGMAVNAIAPGGMTRPNMVDAEIAEQFGNGAFDPALVAPAVVWLAHADCSANGETLGAMAGTTNRIKIAETRGYFSRMPTPEAVRDHFAEIMDETSLGAAGLVFGHEAEARGLQLVERYIADGVDGR